MNILVQLSHPAHFHLYKHVIKNLMREGHQVFVIIKTKDILEDLLKQSGIPYYNVLRVAHRKSRLGILWDMVVRDWKIFWFSIRHHIDLLTGSTPEVAHVGWLLRRYVINTGEDDIPIVPAFAKVAGPFIQCLLTPDVCDNAQLERKSVHYRSYHELAYLHPNHFQPSEAIVNSYGIDTSRPYFVMRFAALSAHHDTGIRGIDREVAQRLVDILSPHGRIYITSERALEPEFEQYRIHINTLDIHHVMAYASLYIGDSQTMAAEAAVLGVPYVRFNDFVGRIGTFRDLDDVYELGYGVHASVLPADTPIRRTDGSVLPSGVEALYDRVEQLVAMPAEERRACFAVRREKMLADKIDYAQFLTWFIAHYPQSVEQTRGADEAFWKRFK